MSAKGWKCKGCGWANAALCIVCAGCGKTKPRKRKPKPPPSFRPWECVVLALDPAATTGWAIWASGRLHSSGEFPIFTGAGTREASRIVELLVDIGDTLGLPVVVVAERSWGGRMGTGETSAVGFWRFALLAHQVAKASVLLVYPATWRARVLPKGMASAERDAVRACEQTEAARLTKSAQVGADEAAAVLIGKWASQAGEVGVRIGARNKPTI